MTSTDLFRPTTTAVPDEHAALLVALELGRSSWLVAVSAPGADRVSRHDVAAGDGAALLGLLERLKRRAERANERPIRRLEFRVWAMTMGLQGGIVWQPIIPDQLLDQLLAGADAKAAFEKDGLPDELKKALAGRALNEQIVHHLEAGEANGRDAIRIKVRDEAGSAPGSGDPARKGERLVHFDWHPLARLAEAQPCDWGLGLSRVRLVCDEELHLTEPAGQAPCVAGGKAWCRACHPASCPRCGRSMTHVGESESG